MNADPIVCQHFPRVLSNSESQEQFKAVKRYLEKNGFGPWACELKADGTVIGMVGFFNNTKMYKLQPSTELIWRLDSRYWGKGLATEATKKVIKVGFYNLDLMNMCFYRSSEYQLD